MKTISRISLIILIFIISNPCKSQNGVNSPYSRYGFGMMTDRSLGFNKAMGGVSQGFRAGQEINVMNPASYSAVDSLTALIDFGMSLSNGNYKMGNIQKNVRNTSIDYFAFQFRAFRNVGVSFGILPYTNINYNFSSSSENISGTENLTSSYKFSGNGGLHQVYLGVGWKMFNSPLSIGMNASYIYGDYSHTATSTFNESSAYSIVRGYSADISTWKLDGGFQYEFNFNNANSLILGATASLGHTIKNRAIRNTETINSSAEVQGITSDTIRNAFELPYSIDFGLAYRKGNQWRLGADFGIEKWSKCKFPVQNPTSGQYTSQNGSLNDRIHFGVGYDITPNFQSSKLLQRMTYKFGGFYSQTYAKSDLTNTINDKPYEYGLTAGVSIPILKRSLLYNNPKLNIAIQWVHSNIPYINTSNIKTNHLVENYFKLSIGLTFSELWFYKWRVQ